MSPSAETDEVAGLMAAARGERTRARTVSLLEAALQICDSWWERSEDPESLTLRGEILSQLALEADTPTERTKRWTDSLAALEKAAVLRLNLRSAEAYAAIAVDCFQDVFSDLDFNSRLRFLRRGRDRIDAAIAGSTDLASSGLLLARKSAVLRHLALGEASPEGKRRRLDESLRCATLAADRNRNRSTVLELALAEWAFSREETTDERYASRLRRAEECFADQLLAGDEPAQLALARFYRLTFQGLKACQVFPTSARSNTRRIFREAPILAEAATMLWFADYPEPTVTRHLRESQGLLEAAIAAGYSNARVVVALAYVVAITGGVEEGRTVLADICTTSHVAWDKALKLAMEAPPSALFEFGFALGIDQSAVWTRLGTFAGRFLGDLSLAEGLYRAAIRLDPHDPIALTNLARFLIRHGGADAHAEARRLIQKAQNFADRRFTWWRAVLAELDGVSAGQRRRPTAGLPTPTPARSPFADLKDLKREFRRVEGLDDSQQRGYELEGLVYELARLTVGTAAPSYRINRTGGASQIDGFFSHGGDRYRLECKWLSIPADHNDILSFADKLDVVGVGGLFISMSGFTEAAVGRARDLRHTRVMLLMDGEEVRAVFGLQVNFDEVIARKRQYFDQHSQPYYKVAVDPEAA